ncbi:Putative secreted protein [Corynebacterium glyciniphilum AJ 3170]|uniref:Putative secreted protein n=1 Tax=Corynebacterium glyciniphilum AJ 3170 TaxID=1404245 RepID=X5DY23_9CORY|nr:SdpI family protein [Corynebacterium glyciniphilum]AHW65497.1 Putative secreted protein [Corynebacterium glyciniphilum AJ 3170]
MSDALMAVAFPAVMAVVLSMVISQVTKAAARGDLPRSGAVGIRTAATKASDDAWTAGHEAAAPLARTVTLGTSVLAVVIIILSFIFDGAWVTALGVVPFVIVLVSLIPVVRAANRAARMAEAAKKNGKNGKNGKGAAKRKR